MKQKPGFGFRPTDEELLNYYLKNKAKGMAWLVDDTISEINILNHHPASLSTLSRIKSNDSVYYFFVRKQYMNATKKIRKRSTKSWKWKVSGPVTDIKDKRGNKIGERQGLLFEDHEAPKTKGGKSRWVMHEYQISSLPHHNPDSYIICKIFDKGSKETDLSNGTNLGVASQSPVSDSNTVRATSIPPEVDRFPCDGSDPNMTFGQNNNKNPNVQLQTPDLSQEDNEFLCGLSLPYRGVAQHLLSDQEMQENFLSNDSVKLPTEPDDFWRELLLINGGDFKHVFSNQELIMQENRNDFKPKKPLSGIIDDYNSDSGNDARSISATVAPRKKNRIYGVGSLQQEAASAHTGAPPPPTEDPLILAQKLAVAEASLQAQATQIQESLIDLGFNMGFQLKTNWQ